MPGLFDGTSLERPVTCERCSKPLTECGCPRDAGGGVCAPKDQPARVRREKRRGKYVTVITGLDERATDIPKLAKDLRKSLGTGGSVTKDKANGNAPMIELQGDFRDRIVDHLKALGYPAKPSGG